METDESPELSSASDDLLDDYRRWLRQERGLAAESVRCYIQHSKKFLDSLRGPVEMSLAGLSPADVTNCVINASVQSGSVWTRRHR
ncbi:hypothetical protein KNN17_21160 [Arthrobacter bambusae]|uniref:hypothetical protein n=1 Tax=Arthrobacter bambusae TaxID=1338426 RepID=UPI001F50663B|nr:hypothetical protein [Arthrobacter bambusae]MCI0144068.1 hypothetical protein [Arthrobacter bambusae]